MSISGTTIKRNQKLSYKKEIKYYIDKKKYDTALKMIDEFLESYPKDIYANVYKAIIYGEQKKYDQAIEIFEDIVNKPSNDEQVMVFAYKEYGSFLSSMKRNDDAIYYYNLAINRSSENELDTRLYLSRLYSYRKDVDNAINCLTIDGLDSDYLKIKRANIYFDNRKFSNALEELNNVNLKNIKNIYIKQEYNYLYGSILHSLGSFEKAKKYLSLCTNTKNTHYFYEASIKLAIIDLIYDNAAESIIKTKAIIDDKNVVYASKNRAICVLGNSYLKIGNYEKAKECFSLLSDKFSRKGLEMGKLYLYANNLEEAENELENFISDVNIEHYEALFYLAIAKFRLKKYDEAYKITYDVLSVADQKQNELYQIKIELKRLKLLLDIIHNTPIEQNNIKYSYMEKQIINYSKDAAIKHIKTHHGTNAKISKFDDDIIIDELIDKVKDSLDENNKLSYEVFDKYIVNLNNIGYDCSNPINIFVLTIPNTKRIVNMYPFYTDVDTISNENSQAKHVKRLSQIEKFNMKYNK